MLPAAGSTENASRLNALIAAVASSSAKAIAMDETAKKSKSTVSTCSTTAPPQMHWQESSEQGFEESSGLWDRELSRSSQ
jgi:hypothetical protein